MVREKCGVQLKIYRFDVHVGFELNHRSVGYGKQCSWYGHVLRREDGHLLRRALDVVVEVQGKKWRLKRTWKKQVEEENVKIVLRREDALCQSKWSICINKIAAGLRWITCWGYYCWVEVNHLLGILLDFEHWYLSLSVHIKLLSFFPTLVLSYAYQDLEQDFCYVAVNMIVELGPDNWHPRGDPVFSLM